LADSRIKNGRGKSPVYTKNKRKYILTQVEGRNMDNNVVDPIVKEAIQVYGQEKQFHQCVEELGELIVAINHYLRNKPEARKEVAEELADVKLMIRQIEVMMDLEDEVNHWIAVKLRRLAFKLKLGG